MFAKVVESRQNATVPLQPPPGFTPLVRGAQPPTGRGWRLPTSNTSTVRVERPFPRIGWGLYSLKPKIWPGGISLFLEGLRSD